ncbi:MULTISPECIES: helix-turn-helix domain-containing protein [unclassified Cytobacillus]|uniref:helix-turn-helix domain-containing protein n=1 Tax=unclassified Cytobacillus TaxID=2675268 RepID=UPI0030FA125A
MNHNILGPAIKYIRKYRRLTQTELSKKTGLKQNSISGHENQIRSLDEIDINNYANALNVTPQTLFTVAQKIESGDIIKDEDIESNKNENDLKARTIAAHLEKQGEISDKKMDEILKYIDDVFKKEF